jgi:hypothetical protein
MLDRLQEVLAPPGAPLETPPPGGWEQAEKCLGLSLPSDYKLFIQTYGSGRVNNFLGILNPFSGNRFRNMLDRAPLFRADIWQLVTSSEALPPELDTPDDLLAWGVTDNGHMLFWVTRGAPSDWHVCLTGRDPEWYFYPLGMSEFLWRWLAGQLIVRAFPPDVPGVPEFVPGA